MKWVNHMMVTGAIVYAATADPLLAVYSIAGSVLPDRLEGKPPKSKKDYWQWRQKHRTWTHWTVPYLTIIAALLLLHRLAIISSAFWPVATIALFFTVGALLHIIEDSLCGKVPLISYNKKIGIKLFTVNSLGEYFFAVSLTLFLLFYQFQQYFNK